MSDNIKVQDIAADILQKVTGAKTLNDYKYELKDAGLSKTQFMTLVETIDADKLKYIIDHFEEFKPQLRWRERYEKLGIGKVIVNYLKRCRHGKTRVDYRQNRGTGRFYSIGSLSLQSIPREIRHTIARDNYVDIDMVNAHPVILSYLCHTFGFNCEALDEYISNREALLEQIPESRDKAKQIYLAVTNGGFEDYSLIKEPSNHLRRYKDEMEKLHIHFSNLYPDACTRVRDKKIEENNNDFNYKAAFMNSLLCDMENKVLLCMWKFFGSPIDAVLCFDGLMVRKKDQEKGVDTTGQGVKTVYDIDGCQTYLKKVFGINMKLKIKTMDEHLKLPISVPEHVYFDLSTFSSFDNMLKNAVEYTDRFGDICSFVYLEWVEEWVEKALALLKRGGEQVMFTRDSYIDTDTKEVIKTHTLVKVQDLLKTLNVNCKIKNPKYIKGINDLGKKEKKDDEKLDPRGRAFSFDVLGGNVLRNLGYVQHCITTRKMPIYDNIEYYPYLRRKGKVITDSLNLFTGYPLEDVEIPKSADFIRFEDSLLYAHLKTQFFNNDPLELKHFLDHVADLVQCPNKNRGVAHLFYSVQGTGKGMLSEFMGRLLGTANCVTIKDFDRYMEKFNTSYTNKLLKIFEELPEKGGAFNKSDKLKGQIDQKDEIVEPKGFKSYKLKHFAKFWFFTNNENTLYIEGSDRRYTLHKISGEFANDKTYFAPIWAEVEDINFLRSAFEYFATREYDVLNTMAVYDTGYKKNQKENNFPKAVKFFISYVESNFDEALDVDLKISSTHLCGRYKDWCEDGYGKYHKGSFFTQLKRIGIEKPKQLRIDGVKKFCFKINLKTVLHSIRAFNKDNDFNFNFAVDNDGDVIDDELTGEV